MNQPRVVAVSMVRHMGRACRLTQRMVVADACLFTAAFLVLGAGMVFAFGKAVALFVTGVMLGRICSVTVRAYRRFGGLAKRAREAVQIMEAIQISEEYE